MRVFVTGATGFIGRHLLRKLAGRRFTSVACLVRDPERLRAFAPADLPVTAVPGTLEEPPTYASALAECDVVCHLAALTGKGSAAAHIAVNAEATRTLVEQARRAGMPRFLHVSTIAVRYPERERYPYAHAKGLAEGIVRESGLDFAIVRPTIVLGPGSPIGESLLALARAPITPMFGDGRTKVQPVAVTDVAACLANLLASDRLGGEILEVGGADVLTFDELLGKIRQEECGEEPRIVHLPVDLIIAGLRLAERIVPFALPVSSGQFYAFRYDNDAEDSPRLESVLPARCGIDAIVAELVETAAEPTPPLPVRAIEDPAQLDAECRVFCRYLSGTEPTEYVLAQYRRAHAPDAEGPGRSCTVRDRSLVTFARRGLRAARLADSFAVLFARGGLLRRKLTLLLAILESTSPAHLILDTADRGSVAGFLLGGVGRGFGFLGRVLLATLLCGPRLLAERLGKGEGAAWNG